VSAERWLRKNIAKTIAKMLPKSTAINIAVWSISILTTPQTTY